jgi:hypothetical protein
MRGNVAARAGSRGSQVEAAFSRLRAGQGSKTNGDLRGVSVRAARISGGAHAGCGRGRLRRCQGSRRRRWGAGQDRCGEGHREAQPQAWLHQADRHGAAGDRQGKGILRRGRPQRRAGASGQLEGAARRRGLEPARRRAHARRSAWISTAMRSLCRTRSGR